ncbi:uncharacterized protein V3H82_008388 [Fundulus diaphanus]
MKTLQLLIIFSLFILTKEFEVKTDDLENLSLDVGGFHLFRGLTDLRSSEHLLLSSGTSLDQNPLSLHDGCGNFSAWVTSNKQNFVTFWAKIKENQTENGLLTSAETLESCRQNFRILSDNESNNGRFGKNNPVCSSRTSQRADEPIVEFDQQQILMLEDDEVVRRAAASLYDKHPTVSSVQLVGPQQRLQQVKGQALVLSEHSSLVLVGHGARDHSGEMRVSGYSYQDVARIIQSISRTSEKIQTTTVLACDAGSDRRFREALLKKLHEAGIETELHLWTAVVQVTETGEVISQDVSAGGAQWRSEDQTKKVVLTVGRKGEIRRKESDRTGRQVLTNHTRFLGDPVNDRKLYRKAWPPGPTTFIDPDVYKKVDQNDVEQDRKGQSRHSELNWETCAHMFATFEGSPGPAKFRMKALDADATCLDSYSFVFSRHPTGLRPEDQAIITQKKMDLCLLGRYRRVAHNRFCENN